MFWGRKFDFRWFPTTPFFSPFPMMHSTAPRTPTTRRDCRSGAWLPQHTAFSHQSCGGRRRSPLATATSCPKQTLRLLHTDQQHATVGQQSCPVYSGAAPKNVVCFVCSWCFLAQQHLVALHSIALLSLARIRQQPLLLAPGNSRPPQSSSSSLWRPMPPEFVAMFVVGSSYCTFAKRVAMLYYSSTCVPEMVVALC